jgi:hypothetical protein
MKTPDQIVGYVREACGNILTINTRTIDLICEAVWRRMIEPSTHKTAHPTSTNLHPDIRDEVSFYVRNGKPYVGVKDGPELLLTEENCDEWQVRAQEAVISEDPISYEARNFDGSSHMVSDYKSPHLLDLKAWVLGLKEAQK